MSGSLSDAVRAALEKELAAPLAPGLYLVATPIGNLGDVTLRALTVLARADHICCEDTRQTHKLVSHYHLAARLSAYHDHNAARERPKILKWLAGGASVALVSDAGTPLISDPGYKLVREAAAKGFAITSIPGASALLAGLTVSGLPTDSFCFGGFLSPREAAARKRLEDMSALPGTLILFETASRIDRTLKLLGEIFRGRQLVIARELTKRFEEVIRSDLPAEGLIGREWKGELVLLIAPGLDEAVSEDEVARAVRAALERSSLRDAVEEVRRTLRVPRKQVYDLALKFQNGASEDER
ncbi:MAG: 16S rRNA (cytidine(1402)-2'-O)-methyltransferase [Rhodomicrobiaceae bacterium]